MNELQNVYDDVETLKAQVATLQTQMTAAATNIEALSPQALTSGTDLNSLTVGRYYIPDATTSVTILNKPIDRNSNAFIDVVYGATGELQQWFYINSKADVFNNKIYYRYFYENEWSEWFTGYLRADDSGWLNLPLASGISAHNATEFPCRYRKIGNVVYVEGCVKGFADVEKVVAILPEGYRPSKTFYNQTATNGGNTDTFNVRTNGEIKRVSTTLANLSADNYHFINTQFLVD